MEILKVKVGRLLITKPFDEAPIHIEKMSLLLDGIKYDRHFGKTRNADVRTAKLLPRRIEVANTRMVTIVSSEELSEISEKMGFEVLPDDLEANITLSGIKNLTQLPIGTYIRFPRNTILYLTGENLPCVVVSQNIIKRGIDKAKALMFPKHAMGKRGVTALVYAAGYIKEGDEAEIIKPQVLEG